jgi:hypothetical protein
MKIYIGSNLLTTSVAFNIDINDPCLSAIITPPSLDSEYDYIIGSDAIHISLLFTNSIGICGPLNYDVSEGG